MKALKIGGLALVIASSLLFSGCGCGNAKTTEKEVATATETKDTKENKIDEKVSNETQVASGETKTEEVKEDTKESKGTEEKSDKSDKTGNSSSSGSTSSNSNSGSTGNSGSGNSGNSGNHSGNGGNTSNGGNSGNSGNTGSTSHTPTPAPSNGGGNSSNGGGSSSTTPTHTHNWIPITQTIHHPAETRQEDHGHYETVTDSPAWDEEITDFDTICLTCYYNEGKVVRLHGQAEVNAHLDYHNNIGDGFCQYGTKEFVVDTIHHDAVTHQEWVSNIVTVTVKEAWDEVVTVGYQCSECGATK